VPKHGLPIVNCHGSSISGVPHHFHQHPLVHVTDNHDQFREEVSRSLIQLQSVIVVAALQHQGEYEDLLDLLPHVGDMLDGIRWRSPDMLTLLHSQNVSQTTAIKEMVRLVRAGDTSAVASYAMQLEHDNPLPVIVSGGVVLG
jgi:hypothetical protein